MQTNECSRNPYEIMVLTLLVERYPQSETNFLLQQKATKCLPVL